MTTTKVMILFAVILGIGVLMATLRLSPKRQFARQDQRGLIQKLASLDSKARSARSGDLAAVTSLTDEVLNYFGTPETVGILSPFKDRMIRAETDYRNKCFKGISEEKVAHLLNKLAKDLDAPDYAYVNSRQIRFLRGRLLTALPSLITTTIDSKKGVSIDPEMSPLEAVAVTHLIITQKLSNSSFQVSPEEWMRTQHEERRAKNTRDRQSRSAPQFEAKLMPFEETEKAKTLKQLVLDRSADLQPLIDRYLTDLGLPN